MDKITRLLTLYSSLINGEEINKAIFCFENDCSPRAFDRDIEDIRLFLSEVFSVSELKYNRMNNTYSIDGSKKQDLELTEYLFVEMLIKEASVLRKDEFDVLRQRLFGNTRNSFELLSVCEEASCSYKSPEHNKAILKMYGDLEMAIRTRKFLRMLYLNDDDIMQACDIVPCIIRYKSGHLWLVGYIAGACKVTHVALEWIHSFEILRSLTLTERKKTEEYRTLVNNNLQELNNKLVEIVVECFPEDCKILKTVFSNVTILCYENGRYKLRFKEEEDTFINWYLNSSSESVKIIEPSCIKDRLVSQAKAILKNMEV